MAGRLLDHEMVAELSQRVAASVLAWRPQAQVREVRPLTGGSSSLTFLADLTGVAAAETPVVVKVAPPGLPPVRNRDVLRQARLQKALQDVPGQPRPLAPAVLFADAGAPPDVPPFMAMNLVAGDCIEPALVAAADRPAPEQVRARYLDATRLLAALHAIAPADIGLGDEPVVDLGAEIERWTRAFATLPADLCGEYERAAAALLASIPAPLSPVVNHGDYRLGNTLCTGDRVTAIIDWEIWSVGDPRVDVAWLTYFTDDSGHPAIAPGTVTGSPTAAEVVRTYEQARGTPLPELDWFRALARYKEAGLTGLLLKRARKDGRPLSPAMARMEPALPRLVQEALDIVGA